MLEHAGYTVVTVDDGEEALTYYSEHAKEVDLILLDLTMPRLNGEETLRALRDLNQEVRVILSSGYNEQEISERFEGLGLSGFIQKPYQAHQLIEKVREALPANEVEV